MSWVEKKTTPAKAKKPEPEPKKQDTTGFRLSYSGSNTLLECEQKYVYSRIQKVPEDPDSPDSHALKFGSAFHYVCEHTLHKRTKEVPALTQEAIRLYDLGTDDYMKLAACLTAYYQLHEDSKLEVAACEVEIFIPGYYLAYVDAVLAAKDGGWWICDLKTAGQLNDLTFQRLPHDVQLNLYASYADKLADILSLDIENFQGVAYRTTLKPRKKPQRGESVRDYIKRAEVRSWSAYIRKDELHIDETRDTFDCLFRRAKELADGDKPMRNYGACGNWSRPCEFWSQCHGEIFSEAGLQYLHGTGDGKEAPVSIFEESYDDFNW